MSDLDVVCLFRERTTQGSQGVVSSIALELQEGGAVTGLQRAGVPFGTVAMYPESACLFGKSVLSQCAPLASAALSRLSFFSLDASRSASARVRMSNPALAACWILAVLSPSGPSIFATAA